MFSTLKHIYTAFGKFHLLTPLQSCSAVAAAQVGQKESTYAKLWSQGAICRRQKYLFAALALTLQTVVSVAQQVYPVDLFGTLIPPHSLDLSVYSSTRNMDLLYTATLNDPIEPFRNVRLKVTIESNAQVIYSTNPNYAFPTITLQRGVPYLIDGFVLQPYLRSAALVGANDQGVGSVILPEGLTRIMVEVIDIQRNVPISRKAAVTGNFTLSEPPLLQFPACGTVVQQQAFQSYTFSWIPLHIGSGNNPAPVEYTFTLKEILPGIDPNDGFATALKVFERTTMSPNLIYGMTEPLLAPGKMYAWQVTARSLLKAGLLFRNQGRSAICSFYIGNQSGAFLTSSLNAEQEEESRLAPTDCEVFSTDFGTIFSSGYSPAPVAVNDLVKIGWFTMKVLETKLTGDGYTGKGSINVPLLKTDVLVDFQQLKVKPNTLRAYSCDAVAQTLGQFRPPVGLSNGNLESWFTKDQISQLRNYFEQGAGSNLKTSQFDATSPVTRSLPIALDKGLIAEVQPGRLASNRENEPPVFITGLRFSPRQAFLTCAAAIEQGGAVARYAASQIPITPTGVQTNSSLLPLDDTLATNQVYGQVFSLKRLTNSRMRFTCEGANGTSDSPEFTIDPRIVVRSDGAGPVKFGLRYPDDPLDTYTDRTTSVPSFVLPNFPDYQIDPSSSGNMFFDLNKTKSTGWGLAPEYIGLLGSGGNMRLPVEFDFTGNGKKLSLPCDKLLVSEEGVEGRFEQTDVNMKASVGNWKFEVNHLVMQVRKTAIQGIIEGAIKLPIFYKTFNFTSTDFKAGIDATQFYIKPNTTDQLSTPWAQNALFLLDTNSHVKAVMRDIEGEGRKFMPDADLSGTFLLQLDEIDFRENLSGDKSVINQRLNALFNGDGGDFWFDLTNVKLEHLRINPFKLPHERYTLEKFSLPPDALKINGVTATLADFRVRSRDAANGKPEELNLELVVRKGTELIQFGFITTLNSDGDFELDRIEVKLDNIECRCYTEAGKKKRNAHSDMGAVLERVYEQFYAPAYPIQLHTGSLAGGADFSQSADDAAWLADYKAVMLERLRQNAIAGFPFLDGSMTIPFLQMQLPFEQNGTTYRAKKAMERSSADFTFDEIETLQRDGTNRLPLLLTPELMTLMGMSNTALPDNTRLLITDFEINGSSEPSLQNTKVEFTLLVKLDESYAQFVRKDVKVSPVAVEMRDFYLFLEQDVPLNSAVFGNGAITLKKGVRNTGIPKPEEDSYALMLCEGFQKYNVQGTYAVPFDATGDFPQGQLKIRDKTKRDPLEAEQQLVLNFRIDQSSDLNQFIAGVSNTTSDGQAVSFVSEGQESVIFHTNQTSEIYLDFNSDKNQKAMPDHLDDSFQGLYFIKFKGALDGFLDELGQAITVDLEEFYFSPLSGFGMNGMGGSAEFSDLLTWQRKAKLGGWRYTIDQFSLDFTKAAFNKDPSPFTLEGRMHCPIFRDKDTTSLVYYSGSLSFEKSKATDDEGETSINYHPSGSFSMSTHGKSENFFEKKKFFVDWLPGAEFFLKKGCVIDLTWVAFDDGAQGFLPRVELNGGVGLHLSKGDKVTPEITSENGTAANGTTGSLEFTLPAVSFEGLKINHPESDKSGRIGGTSGVKSLEFGTWGLGSDALLEKSERKQPFMYFPITISTPEVSWRKADQRWLMKIEIALNLLGKEEKYVDNDTDARHTEYKEKVPEGGGIQGNTILNFKFKPGTTKAVEFAGVELEEIGVAGFFAAFEVEAIVRFIKDGNEKEWGNGVAGKGVLKLTEGPELAIAGIFQFGRIQRNAPDTTYYRYFFADMEATWKTSVAPHFGYGLIKVAGIDVLNLHGMGGGIWYNMEKTSPADYKAPEEKTTPLGAEFITGRGITGFEYTPKEFSYGGYIKGIFSLAQPSMYTLDLALGIEIGKNNAGHMSLKKIFAKGVGYMMIEGVADRDGAPITAEAEIEMDFNNKRLSGFFKVDAKVLLPDEHLPLVGLRIDPAVSRGSLLIEFKQDGKFYLKIGTPANRFELNKEWFGLLKLKLGAYIQIGKDIDPIPPIDQMVPGWPAPVVQTRSIDVKNGICFGAGFSMKQSFNFGIFYAALQAAMGFDLALGTTPLKCNNKKLGMNGWIIKGQVYALAGASVGLEYKIGPKRGRVVIMSATVAAMLSGQMVSPTILRGQLAGKFSVLGGLVSGSFNLRFRVASQRDLDCMNEALSNPNAALAAFPIVSDKYPDTTSSKDVPIFANPKLTYNLAIGSELQLDDVDIDGNPITRIFKPVLDPNAGVLLKQNGITIPCEYVFEAHSTTLKPLRMLDPKAEYTLSWYVRWQRKIDGQWQFLPDSTAEKGTVKFTTGNLPDVIVNELLDYLAPGHNQRYWHAGYAEPRIKFSKTAPSGNSWQQVYFPQSKQVEGYGLLNYDYLVRLTRYKDGKEERTYDVPLSEYPGLKNFQIPVTSFIQVGTLFRIPRVEVQNQQGLSVAFSGLADTITATDDWKSKLCKLELVRLPILPKAELKTSSKSTTAQGGNQTETSTNIATTSLATNESKIPVEDGFKILYRYYFATSTYSNLSEKLAETEITAYKSAQKRTDYDHPDDATELEFSFKNSDTDFPGFTDDYFGFQNKKEGFDKYDLDRIRLNAEVSYLDKIDLLDALWNPAEGYQGAQQFEQFSEIAFADGLNYNYNFVDKDGDWFRMRFACQTGAAQIASYKELLQTSNQLNLTTLKKYWKSRMINPIEKDDWTSKFLLPPTSYNELTTNEIAQTKLSYAAYTGQAVEQGLSGQVITEPRSYGLMFQNNISRISGLQYMTMRASIYKAFQQSVQSAFFAAARKKDREKIQIRFHHWDAWNPHFWNFKDNAQLHYVHENTWHTGRWASKADPQINADFNPIRSWYEIYKAYFPDEQSVYYKGRIQLNVPKLNKWQDMGQSVKNQMQLYPQWQATMYPNRPGGGATNEQVNANIAATVQNEADKFQLSRADKIITLQNWPTDADLQALEIALAPNGTDYQRVVYFDATSREADLYSPDGARSIKYNASLPGTEQINLSALFSIPAIDGNTITTWTTDNLYKNQQVRVRFKTAKGSYSFVGAPSANTLSLTRESATFDLKRQKAIHLTRGSGSNANMLVMRKIGAEGDWDFGTCLLINADTKEAVAHLDRQGKLTRFNYTTKGVDTLQSNYVFGNNLLQLNPQVNYAVYMAKAGQTTYSVGLSLDRERFWQDKVGQFFEGRSFGSQNLGSVELPALAPYNAQQITAPARVQAEHFAQMNVSVLSAKGFAYNDRDSGNSFKNTNQRNVREDESVDLQQVRDTFLVSNTGAGEWLKYPMEVPANGDWFMLFAGRTADAGKRAGLRVQIDGVMLPDSVVFEPHESVHLNYKKRIPKINLNAGQHIITLHFDGNVALDYFELRKLEPRVKVQYRQFEIQDNSTGAIPTDGTDFGNAPCGAERTYSIINTGSGTLQLRGRPAGNAVVQISGPQADAFQLIELPAAQLQELDTTYFAIRFAPKAQQFGDYQATVAIYTNAPGTDSVYTFQLKATNNPVEIDLSSGDIQLASSTQQPKNSDITFFNNLPEGVSFGRPFTIYNRGKVAMPLQLTKSGEAADEFFVQNFPTEVKPGESASFRIGFIAQEGKRGQRTAKLEIGSSDCDENPFVLMLGGSVSGSALSFQPQSKLALPSGNLFQADLSFEAWVKPMNSNWTNEGNILEFGSGATKVYWKAANTDAKPAFGILKNGERQEVVGTSGISPNAWTHLAVRYNDGAVQLFVNGEQRGNGKITHRIDGLFFDQNKVEPKQALVLDELRIWNIALGAQQISQNRGCELLGNEQGLKLYYRFNQGLLEGDNKAISTEPNSKSDALGAALLNGFDRTGLNGNYVSGAFKSGSVCSQQFALLEVRTPAGQAIQSGSTTNPATDFGKLTPGTDKELSFQLANLGASPTSGQTTITITGADAHQFELVQGWTNGAITPNGKTDFKIRCKPSGSGGLRQAVVLIENAGANSLAIHIRAMLDAPGMALTGNNKPIALNRTTVSVENQTDFGDKYLGRTTWERSYSITNSGLQPLKLDSLRLAPGSASCFSLVQPPALTLISGQTAVFKVILRPQALGNQEATIVLPTNIALGDGKFHFLVKTNIKEPGNVLAFDGQDDVLETPPDTYFKSAFTLEAWVNVQQAGGNTPLLEFAEGATKTALYLTGADQKPQLLVNNQSAVKSRVGLPLNLWQHVAVVCDGSRAWLYINGEEQGTGTVAGRLQEVRAKCLIGNKSNVRIDDFRLWQRALDASELKHRMKCGLRGNEPGLALYYPMTQGIPGGDNTEFHSVTNAVQGATEPGELRQFALAGAQSSNWLKRTSEMSSQNCAPFEVFRLAQDQNFATILPEDLTIDFGRHYLSDTIEKVLYIKNLLSSPLKINSIRANGKSGTKQFSLPGITDGLELAPLAVAPITLRFVGSAAGSKTGELVLTSNQQVWTAPLAGSISPETVLVIKGTDTLENRVFHPTAHFGVLDKGESRSMSFRLKNVNPDAARPLLLKNSNIVLVTGSHASQFVVTRKPAATLAAHGEDSLTVEFRPNGEYPGTMEGSLVIQTDAATGGEIVIKVRGELSTPRLAVAQKNKPLGHKTGVIDFGKLKVDSEKELRVQVRNNGTGTLTWAATSQFVLSGPHASQFKVQRLQNTNQIDSTELLLICKPTGTPGDRIANLSIKTNDPVVPEYQLQLKAEATEAWDAVVLDFDGKDDYIELPPDNYLKGNFTVQARLSVLDALSNDARLLELGNGLTENLTIGLSYQNTGRPYVRMIQDGAVRTVVCDSALQLANNDVFGLPVTLTVTVNQDLATIRFSQMVDFSNYRKGSATGQVFAPKNMLRTQNAIGKNTTGRKAVHTRFRLHDLSLWNQVIPAPQLDAQAACQANGTDAGLEFYLLVNQGFYQKDNTTLPYLTDQKEGSSRRFYLRDFSLKGEKSNYMADPIHQYPDCP